MSETEYIGASWTLRVVIFVMVVLLITNQLFDSLYFLMERISRILSYEYFVVFTRIMFYIFTFLFIAYGFRTFRFATISQKEQKAPILGQLLLFKTKVRVGKEAKALIIWNYATAIVMVVTAVFFLYVAVSI